MDFKIKIIRPHLFHFTFYLIPLLALILLPGVAASAPTAPASPAVPTSSAGLRVNRIVVKGCRQIPRRTVLSILQQQKTPWYRWKPGKTAFDPFWAEDDRRRIELFYRSRGFYSVAVAAPLVEVDRRRKGVKITYSITEGPPTLVGIVEVIYEDGTYREKDRYEVKKLIKLKAGGRFELEAYQQSADAITHYFQDWGFFRVKVQRQADVDPGTRTAVVTYRVNRGPRYKIRSIKVLGTSMTAPRDVFRALDLKPETWYNRGEVIKNQRRVQKLTIYKTVRVVEDADDEARRVDLTVKVEEAKPREVRLGLGYGSEDGPRVQLGWRHSNFLGGARELNITTRWSAILESEEIKLVQPNAGRPGNFISLNVVRSVEHER